MRHAPHVRRWIGLMPLSVLFVACANAPLPGSDPTDVPAVAEIVCEADGSTTIRTPEVLVQPDGIHVHVVSRLDEPAQMVGLFGSDVEPGGSDYISVVEPGTIEAGCFPYSQHEDPDSLITSPIEVLDPDGTYVDGEVDCSGMMRASVSDFAEPALDAGPVPLEEARPKIRGLQAGDEVLLTGYPEQAGAAVAVRRGDEIVATFSFVTFDGQEWVIEGSSICESSGLR